MINHANFLVSMATAIGLVMVGSNGLVAQSGDKTEITPVKISEGVAKLDPTNTLIEFVGTHVGDDPQPRLGGFKIFTGEIKLADDHSMIESMQLEIDVDSVWTEFNKLTTHLKNADFFETDKHGKAKFVSTKIGKDAQGLLMVTGNLTLLGTTGEVSFPARARMSENGIVLMSEFNLDRTKFGMDKMTSGVEKSVAMKFVVGQKTNPRKPMDGPGTEQKKESDGKSGSSNQELKLQSISHSVPNME